MRQLLNDIPLIDQVALCLCIAIWVMFEIVNDHTRFRFNSLSGLMARKRREWMLVLADRELRIVDTSIIAGLQNGTVFFASTCIFAIGGCFALINSADVALDIYRDLSIEEPLSRSVFEMKVLGLALIFIYSFFKFAWSARLFNYCAILIGSVRQPSDAEQAERRKQALVAAEVNIIASRHFTAGLRGIFFALGYLGWFIGPYMLVATTVFVLVVLVRRQYFSQARKVLLDEQVP
ncbi:MAG: DUF599 family protein [Rhizobiaceae bacterium]|nr:DUF599 family protein [Rhizobiaceae bacterium]